MELALDVATDCLLDQSSRHRNDREDRGSWESSDMVGCTYIDPDRCCSGHKAEMFTYAFIVIGYAIYVAMWIPIHRYLFVYEYMPALYLAFMALAIVLAQSWQGKARDWEHLLLLMSLLPALVLGLGTVLGSASFFGMTLIYVVLRHYNQRYAGRWVCLLFLGGAFAALLYFISTVDGVADEDYALLRTDVVARARAG